MYVRLEKIHNEGTVDPLCHFVVTVIITSFDILMYYRRNQNVDTCMF